jgi:hypothetical protein
MKRGPYAQPLIGQTFEMPAPQTDWSPTRNLTQAEIRGIISQRRSGQTVPNIARGMNLPSLIVLRVIKGEVWPELSAPIFAKMVFPGPD